MNNADLTTIGSLSVSSIGIGTWAWGDRSYWGYGTTYGIEDLRIAFQKSLDLGINFFDTAEAYGRGLSEKIIGSLIEEYKADVVIATKFMPYPWRIRRKDFRNAFIKSLNRLGLTKIHLYQIHWPFPPIKIEKWVDCLADLVLEGLCDNIGVSNYNYEQLERAMNTLAKRGVKLASNQVPYHLLNRNIEFNGVFDLCKAHDVKIISYSPLAQGILTGKYHPENPPKGVRYALYSPRYLLKVSPLLNTLSEISSKYNRTPAQVALNWLICKGTIPIPGVKNLRQLLDNAGALNWRLSVDDINILDQVSLAMRK
jgi:aryl-alcohol dehydrogenase-like predicted oxidoreductase